MLNDRQITIAVGQSRKDMNWINQTLTLSALFDKLKTPLRGLESHSAYDKLPKTQRDALKDVGGFVGGSLSGGRRKASAVQGRDLITLDLDAIKAYDTPTVLKTVDDLGYSYCIYSTRSHHEIKPRLRILIPLDRTVSVDEYEPISRRLAEFIGIHQADPTTFEASRLMYWPSCCADGEYIYKMGDKPLAPADSLLATYADWRDWMSWPQVPGTASNYQKLAVKQGDPTTKAGMVGAFNRTYGIQDAMDTFLPGIYAPCDNDPNRFTYLGGSTVGGVVLYDDDKFIFSHHATDPCSGRLVSAFDMVRLHKFGDLDDTSGPDVPVNKLPSYSAMCDFAAKDKAVSGLLGKERYEQAIADFAGMVAVKSAGGAEDAGAEATPGEIPEVNADDTEWLQLLERHPKTAEVKSTIDNILLILAHDKFIKDKIGYNSFTARREILGVVPWASDKGRRVWSDEDSSGLYWFMEKVYGVTGRGNIDAALDVYSISRSFNELHDYINGLQWDGIPRLDTLLIDYLGAEDSPYVRAVTRKMFTAAIARAMVPGTKHDCMLILCGKQGLGKSTILERMSLGYFNDSIRTFEGKEAAELLAGVWLVEIAELDAFRRTDVARIKQFLSLTTDRYRAAYGRNVREIPRSCVFFGTCNESLFLTDRTGNRRFWPVDVGVQPRTKSIWVDLTDDTIRMVWAEAKLRWQMGEDLFLSGEIAEQAMEQQELHRDASYREGIIQDFVEHKVPVDWNKWDIGRRRDFWAGTVAGEVELVDRQSVTALEICCEAFNCNVNMVNPMDIREVNACLAKLPGWERATRPFYAGKDYKTQRGFKRMP